MTPIKDIFFLEFLLQGGSGGMYEMDYKLFVPKQAMKVRAGL